MRRSNPNVVRCAGGVDTGDTCLSDAQITALNVMNTDAKFNFFLASGLQTYPGYNVWGCRSRHDRRGNWVCAAGRRHLPGPRDGATGMAPCPQIHRTSVRFLTSFSGTALCVDVNGTVNTLLIDPENPGAYANALSDLSTQLDTSTDISAFVAPRRQAADRPRQGRRACQYPCHRMVLPEIAGPNSGLRRSTPLPGITRSPGLGHAYSAAFTPGWDSLTALENWAEKGIAPTNQIITDTSRGRRPHQAAVSVSDLAEIQWKRRRQRSIKLHLLRVLISSGQSPGPASGGLPPFCLPASAAGNGQSGGLKSVKKRSARASMIVSG